MSIDSPHSGGLDIRDYFQGHPVVALGSELIK